MLRLGLGYGLGLGSVLFVEGDMVQSPKHARTNFKHFKCLKFVRVFESLRAQAVCRTHEQAVASDNIIESYTTIIHKSYIHNHTHTHNHTIIRNTNHTHMFSTCS